jgi:hypothetical protein
LGAIERSRFVYLKTMGPLRLYRKIYCVTPSLSGDTYTLITPSSISASTYVAGTGGTESSAITEYNLTLTEEETGIYYADLTYKYYTSDITYDLVWYLKYTEGAPEKKLTTRFRIKPFNIAGQLDYEVISIYPYHKH